MCSTSTGRSTGDGAAALAAPAVSVVTEAARAPSLGGQFDGELVAQGDADLDDRRA